MLLLSRQVWKGATFVTISDWIMIVAVLLAPLSAVYTQRSIDHARDRQRRKLLVFQTLMATRAARLSMEHVRALNMIDTEFGGRLILGKRYQSEADKCVVQRWREYFDSKDFGTSDATSDDLKARLQRSEDAFVELVYQMSRALGYEFDKVQVSKGIYSPVAHEQLEEDQRAIRQSLVKILSGEYPLTIQSRIPDEMVEPNAQLLRLLLAVLDGSRPLCVANFKEAGPGQPDSSCELRDGAGADRASIGTVAAGVQ